MTEKSAGAPPRALPFNDAAARLERILLGLDRCVVACSGGVDSMLLAVVAGRLMGERALIVHAVSPAVPEEATRLVRETAAAEGWALHVAKSGEFGDERYLSNPTDRCYYCKTHLYGMLSEIAAGIPGKPVLLSGTNQDDLAEFRPGLKAAAEAGVRHPYVEAGFAKKDIRELAKGLGLDFSDKPASPCLASRLYSGTRVTAPRLAAVEFAEAFLQRALQIQVLRCRMQGDEMKVETTLEAMGRVTSDSLSKLRAALAAAGHAVTSVQLDPVPYRSGRAFVPIS